MSTAERRGVAEKAGKKAGAGGLAKEQQEQEQEQEHQLVEEAGPTLAAAGRRGVGLDEAGTVEAGAGRRGVCEGVVPAAPRRPCSPRLELA